MFPEGFCDEEIRRRSSVHGHCECDHGECIPQALAKPVETDKPQTLQNKNLSVMSFTDHGLIGPLSRLPHTDAVRAIEEHERLSGFPIGGLVFLKQVGG